MEDETNKSGAQGPTRIKPEYVLIGVLLLIGAVAVPALADVYLVQSFVLSICTGLGFQ
ncbi:MAG: hypothetical protein HOI96_09990 [Rhodospirillaceae bacterium]|nr:hypothetical protein [Rhodospirillaceae bacterium]